MNIQNSNQMNNLIRQICRNPKLLETIEQTEELQLELVKINYQYVRHFNKPAESVIKMILENKPDAIAYIRNLKDIPNINNMLMGILINDPLIIRSIPEPTIEMMEIAIKNDPYYIKYIQNPPDTIMKLALDRNPDVFYIMKNPSDEIKIYALQKNPSLFKQMKKSTNLIDMVLNLDGMQLVNIQNPSDKNIYDAINNNGLAIQFILFPNDELINIALNNNGLALEFIDRKTFQMIDIAIKNNPLSIKFVDLDNISLFNDDNDIRSSMINYAIETNPNTVEFINEKFISESQKEYILNKNPSLAIYFDNIQDELCITLLTKDIKHISLIKYPSLNTLLYIAENNPLYLTKLYDSKYLLWKWDICIALVSKNWECIKYIPYEMFINYQLPYPNPTYEIQLAAVKNSYQALYFIPSNCQTHELKQIALQNNGYAIQFIKEPSKDEIIQAVTQNGLAIKYVYDLLYGQIPNDNNVYVDKFLNIIPFDDDYTKKIAYQASIRSQLNMDELYKLAVKQNGLALEFIKNQTNEIITLALEQNLKALEYVAIITKDILQYAYNKNPNVLQDVNISKNIKKQIFIYILSKIQNRDDDEEDLCPICLNELCENVYKTKCGHIFHAECLMELAERDVCLCSICKCDIAQIDIQEILKYDFTIHNDVLM